MIENIHLQEEDKIKSILQNKKVRHILVSKEKHQDFVWLVYTLIGERLSYLLDDNFIPLLKNSSDYLLKYDAIIRSGNDYVNNFLSKEDNLKVIVENISFFKFSLKNLDNNFAYNFFNYIVVNNYPINHIKYLSSSSQIYLLKYNIIKARENIILEDMEVDTISYLLNDHYFKEKFINYNINTINNLILKHLKLPLALQDSKILINTYLKIDNLYKHHTYVEALKYDNIFLFENIKKARITKFEEQMKIMDINKIFEIICIVNFEDYATNVLYNIDRMLTFIAEIDIKIISKDRLIIYNKLLNFNNLNKEELINLYYELKEIPNNISKFYDDYKACFDYANTLLKNSCYNLEEHSAIKEVEGIKVYKVDEEDFNILLTHSFYPKKHASMDIKWEKLLSTVSCSVINNNCLGTYEDPKSYVLLGFNNFNPKNIMHMCTKDSYSSKLYSSDFVIDIHTPSNLTKRTFRYNEILLKQNSDLYPDYVVCYDTIKNGDIKVAHGLNIPIVLIDTSKCNVKKNNVYYFLDKYDCNDLNDTINLIEGRKYYVKINSNSRTY